MRLLIVSHSAAVPVNQALYGEVARITGWKISLVIPSNWVNDYGKRCAAELMPGLDAELIPVPVRRTGDIILHWYKGSMSRLLRDQNPDVIYVHHEPYAVATAQVYLANYRTVRRPIGFYSAQNIKKRYPAPFRWTESMVYRQSSFCFPISPAVEAVLREKGYRNDSVILPLGIDTRLYYPAPDSAALKLSLRRQPDEILIGYLGRIVPEKGLATLLEGLARIKDLSWRLIVAGAGPYEAEFDANAAKLGLSGRISRIGFVPHQQAPVYLGAFDIMVLPSETQKNWKEQFGRVILEAMACGTPVVGSDSGEIPKLIGDTQGGLVFRERDSQHLSECLRTMIQDPELRRRLADHGRRHVEEQFALSQLAGTFIRSVSAAVSRPVGDPVPAAANSGSS